MPNSPLPFVPLVCLTLALTACSVGPNYQRPAVRVPAAYKEPPPASFSEASAWKAAQPNDDVPRGQWWEIFGDPQLNALEEQVDISNQTLAATVATYRQTVLTAFQGVEDNLAALRFLEEEALQQENAVKAAEASLLLAVNRYKAGVTTYLEVITAQSAALTAERTALDLSTRRMVASVALILALGGGWGASST